MTSRNYFKGKRVTLVGLGPHGEMVEDAKFLIKAGSLLSVYDLRSEARLKSHLIFLRSIGLANYVCSSIPADDLLDSDLIILSHEYPRTSTFLEKARAKGIPIEYPETLFFKLAPPLTVVGVIGAVGKTSVVSLLAPMLEIACKEQESQNGNNEQNLFVADPDRGDGILTFLKKAKNGDILLIKIVSSMLPEFHGMRMSPHVAIFASLPHPMSYGKSPFEILEYQTYNNFLVAGDDIIDMTRSYDFKPRAKMLRTKPSIIPPIWEVNVHSHERMNIALALQAARLFRVTDEQVKDVVEEWRPGKGNMELVKKIKGVEFYNDTSSTLPESTVKALKTLAKDRNITLICGGSDTGLDYAECVKVIPEHVHTLILVPGSGTIKYRSMLQNLQNIKVLSAPGIEEAVRLAKENSVSGNIVLFSPGFAAQGLDPSEKARGERFVRAVRSL
ncbi:MAG: cyanophycin synthetase [Candidatus Paceibacterota bacterium]